MCNCKEKIVLYEPKFAMEAYEHWCPKHGYQNDCYLCDPKVGTYCLCGNSKNTHFSTELCLRHRTTPMELCPKHKDIFLRKKEENNGIGDC